jgi:hypothetical protein
MVADSQLDFLLKEFVNIYGKMTDIGLDVFLEPPLWFMPIESNIAKREAAHYFLLAAALCDTEVTGNSRNVRVLLDDFHDVFGPRLYGITNPNELEVETQKCESSFKFFDQMGPRKGEIPKIVADVNVFVRENCRGDIVEHTKQMILADKKPADLFDELCQICKRDRQQRDKFWIYLRWMTRKHPDLGLFDFKTENLTVPLTTPTLNLVAVLELMDNKLAEILKSKEATANLWQNPQTTQAIQTALNNYAKLLFPDDPAKVDFPFFLLGRWLSGCDLNRESVTNALQFLIDKYHKIGTWPIRYLVERRHMSRYSCDFNIGAQSQLELPVADYLLKEDIKFEFEPLQFWWAKEQGIVAIPPPYTPDFLLSLKHQDKKVLLEPHGVWEDLKDYMGKLHTFKKNYGLYFYLILIVPENFITPLLKIDPKQETYDQLWTIEEFPRKMRQLRASCSTY